MNHDSTAEAQLLAFYMRYSKQLSDLLGDAHETIGGLRYYLEINNIELPKRLAPKKEEKAEEEVTMVNSLTKDICLN